MLFEILKAMLAGAICAVPVGPILILVIQKTLCSGRAAGMMTGLGSSLADAIFAAIGLFALSLVQDVLAAHQTIILGLGGVVIVGVGLIMMRAHATLDGYSGPSNMSLVGYALQAFTGALSNLGALAVMMALLASFGLDSPERMSPTWALILAVFGGQMLYWNLVTILINKFIRVSARTLDRISRISGIIVVILGICLSIKGIFFTL